MTGPQQTLTLTKRGEGAARVFKMMTTYTDRLCVCCGEKTPWPLRGMNVAPRCQACRRGCSSQRSEPCQKTKKA
jgi:hypothetical protein